MWDRLDLATAVVEPGGTAIFGPGPYLKIELRETKGVVSPGWDTQHRVRRVRNRRGPKPVLRDKINNPDVDLGTG